MAKILVVDDEQGMRELLSFLLSDMQHEVLTAANLQEALGILRAKSSELALVISDLRLPDGSGMTILAETRAINPNIQVIMMTAFATAENAVEAMKAGAYDYQIKPFKIDEISLVIQKALEKYELLTENLALKQKLLEGPGSSKIFGKSEALMATLELAAKVARAKTSVLILGESGTGKELLARYIHQKSPRAKETFCAINCGAIPDNLIESELFGHIKGSFTGADKEHIGLFESASRGTIFLDEVTELPLAMQVKLLRVLQEQTIRRVGEAKERSIDVRVISATNRDIKALVENGEFREDLYYRLNVVSIKVPPLRERKEDIPTLARAFLLKYGADMGLKAPMAIQEEALNALIRYNYPGNIRELENIMERALALCDSSQIRLIDLPEFMQQHEETLPQPGETLPTTGINLENYIDSIEKNFLEQALRQSGGSKTHAAKLLGLTFRSMRYRLKKYGFQDEE